MTKFCMLAIVGITFLNFCSLNSSCQTLKNTEWTRILVENNVDGNFIVNPQLTKKPIKYFFLEDTVLISTDESYSTKSLYSLHGGILSIGNFVKYKIDTLNEQLLIVSDVPKPGVSSAKLGTFTLMNTDFIFDYLRQTKQLTIINDSLIIANELFCPVYNGEINQVFSQLDAFDQGIFTGSFTISKDRNIRDIQILNGKKDDKIRISNMLISTKDSWIIPPTPKLYDCKIDFELSVSVLGNFMGANIYLHPQKK